MNGFTIKRKESIKSVSIMQIVIAVLGLAGALFALSQIIFSELSFKDHSFATYFGILVTISAICFFILTRNTDNEETNPGKEKGRR